MIDQPKSPRPPERSIDRAELRRILADLVRMGELRIDRQLKEGIDRYQPTRPAPRRRSSRP